MAQPTIDNVRPLIVHEQLDGHTLSFVFACPTGGTQVTATHTVTREASASSHVLAKAKRSALFAIRGPVASAIRSAFGTSNPVARLLGDVGSTVAYSAAAPRSHGSNAALSRKQKDEAAVAAFASVIGEFEWDGKTERWISSSVARELHSPFQRQLASAPLASPYDRELSARMLVEVARADGSFADEETAMLREFLDSSVGSVESLSKCPPLTAAELGEASEGPARVTLMALAWALALSDKGLDASEEARLDQFAEGLELDHETASKAKELAQAYLVDITLTQTADEGELGRLEAQSFADAIGLSSAEFEVVEARYRKRRALTVVA